MRIGISAYGTRGLHSGLGHYLRNVLRVLLRDHAQHEYRVYCQEDERDAFDFPELGLSPVFHCGSRRHAKALYDILWHNFVLPWLARKHRLDVLFITVDRRVPVRCSVPVVGTVHDLAAFTVDDKYPLSRQFYSKRIVPFLIQRLDGILTISDATRSDMVTHLGLAHERISLAHNGVDAARFRDCDRSAIPAALARYGVREPYLLYTARLEHPGKNHVGLIKALATLDEGPASRYQLVLVGNPWRNVGEIERTVTELGLEERVVFTGYVADDDIPLLYAGAELFVFPSFYEGFGLPLLEAMAAGVPMAVARVSSLPEVAGDAAEFFDPSDVGSIAAAIRRLADDADLREQLTRRGRERVKEFTWERCASRTLDVLCAAAE